MQRFRCLRCHKTFSEAQPLEGLRVEHQKVIQIVKLLCEGMGVRACARFADCQPHTVLNVLETVGAKCHAFLDQKLRNLQVGCLQIDELWARVGVSQRRIKANDAERGDQYTFLAITSREKLIVAHHTGKRDYENTDIFVKDLASRIVGRVQITTDGWAAYPDTIRSYLLERLDYAVMQKIYANEIVSADSARRYSPAACTGVKVFVRAGKPAAEKIGTSFVERTNLTVRHFNKRFARLGLGYSRKLANHRHAISLFVAAYNFCKIHSTLGTTPAQGAGIVEKPWKINELIDAATNC